MSLPRQVTALGYWLTVYGPGALARRPQRSINGKKALRRVRGCVNGSGTIPLDGWNLEGDTRMRFTDIENNSKN